MEKIIINGGKKLYGEIEIPSAKNTLLPILAACVLIEDSVTIKNFPHFVDVLKMSDIIQSLGANAQINDNCISIDCSKITKYEISANLASELRSSIFTLGSILGRHKKAKVAYPGGCAIGARPIDLHLKGLRTLGVKIIEKHGYIYCDGSSMKGNDVHLDFPSVGATENIMMAAATICGKTRIFNAAKEPEIVDLQNFLNMCGANIKGAGSEVIEIQGSGKLFHGCEYTPIGDRIIAGTYAIAVTMTGGKIKLHNCKYIHLYSLFFFLKMCGAKIKEGKNFVTISMSKKPKKISKIETAPYPGFATDLQAQMVALLSICNGTSVMVENLFECRYKHISELKKMGADILIKDRSAIINGVKNLYGAEVVATDLRAGACLVLAGLVCKGYTTISNIELIDRGYYHIENDFKKLGADIKRVNI